mmetsp:Transcript_2949/g.8122  ORF Transcript_2949/g.8122 Transcript_2949/m.8122 type:complete len:95 (+) Transcript_2949:84-368(+)
MALASAECMTATALCSSGLNIALDVSVPRMAWTFGGLESVSAEGRTQGARRLSRYRAANAQEKRWLSNDLFSSFRSRCGGERNCGCRVSAVLRA